MRAARAATAPPATTTCRLQVAARHLRTCMHLCTCTCACTAAAAATSTSTSSSSSSLWPHPPPFPAVPASLPVSPSLVASSPASLCLSCLHPPSLSQLPVDRPSFIPFLARQLASLLQDASVIHSFPPSLLHFPLPTATSRAPPFLLQCTQSTYARHSVPSSRLSILPWRK